MTTSFISQCAGDLRDNDLQALKDYALEAPWEWRKLFEALIEVVEDEGATTSEISKSAMTVSDAAIDLINAVRKELEDHKAALCRVYPKGAALCQSLDEAADAMEEALKKAGKA